MVAVKKQVNNKKRIKLLVSVWLTISYCLIISEKGLREHQCASGAGYEIRQVLPGLQANAEDPASGQGQTGAHRQQHARIEVKETNLKLCSSFWLQTKYTTEK